jgi:hypothetical protein
MQREEEGKTVFFPIQRNTDGDYGTTLLKNRAAFFFSSCKLMDKL